MAFQKKSDKYKAAVGKPVAGIFAKVKQYPKITLVILILSPLVLLWLIASNNVPTQSKKPSGKAVQVKISQQNPQELAEQATLALRQHNTDKFLELLDSRIKDPNIVNSQGDSLLLAAATLGNRDAVLALLAKGADVNKQNYNTRDTAILRSIYMDQDDIAEILTYADANLNLTNNYRQSPMGLAIEKQKGKLVELFLSHGVKVGVNGKTLLRSSASKNFVGVFGMLKGGVDPNVTNEKGNTPLIISASLGDNLSVKHLLAYRADVNAANLEGDTALIYAARYNHPETVLELFVPFPMKDKVNINAQNKRGETALYWAALKGYAPIVKILLAYDADKTIKTNAGVTAYQIAKKYQHKEVMKLLKMNLNKLKISFNEDLAARQDSSKNNKKSE